MSAQEALDAKNAHLRSSLLLHAERVNKRASEEQRHADKPSPQERLMAIRRRVAARKQQGSAEKAPPSTADDQGDRLDGSGGVQYYSPAGGHRCCADGQPEAGGGGDGDVERRRIELHKIHLAEEGAARRIRDPACEARGARGEDEQRGKAEAAVILGAAACGDGVAVASDTANAASRAAWHAIDTADLSR